MNNKKNIFVLTSIFLLFINTSTIGFLSDVFAVEEPLSFGLRFFPTKFIEKSEGKIEVFALRDEKVFPTTIHDLTITSQNPEILKITGKEFTEDYTTLVNIMPEKQGTTTIALAAPGFESSEFSVTVYHNNQNEKKITVKALPDKFSVNGPNKGYLSVELLDEDGVPTMAREDVTVNLSVSNPETIDLISNEMVIEKGNYYAIQEFSVDQFDDSAIIYASAPNVETAETKISVVPPSKPLIVKLFVSPDRASRTAITNAFAVVQLQDANGNPIKAPNDIPVSIMIDDPYGVGTLSPDGRITKISPSSNLVIKKGEYWDATKLITNAGVLGKYFVGISAKGYAVSPPQELEIVDTELIDQRNVVFDPMPTLASGKEELIGIVHMEDNDEKLLIVNQDLKFKIFSSDEEALSIKNVQIDKGQISAEVYGKLGYVKPNSLSLNEAYENKELPELEIFGPRKATLKLVSEPLVTKVMSNANVPIVVYPTVSDGSVWYFPSNTDIFFSPSELLDLASESVKEGSSPILIESFAKKEGSETLLVKSGTLSAEMQIKNHLSVPTIMDIDVPQRVFAGMENKMIAQILDDENRPIFANSDVEIKVISNDEKIIDITDEFKIKHGESFTMINLLPQQKGSVELAVLATGFPLIKKTINVEELKPDVEFESPKTIESNTSFVSSILATLDGKPLSNMDVSWDVTGAAVQERQSKTDAAGKSTIALLSGNKTITLNASISNDIFPTTTHKQIITINSTNSIVHEEKAAFEIFGIDVFLLLVPSAIITSGIVMKKTGRMKIKS